MCLSSQVRILPTLSMFFGFYFIFLIDWIVKVNEKLRVLPSEKKILCFWRPEEKVQAVEDVDDRNLNPLLVREKVGLLTEAPFTWSSTRDRIRRSRGLVAADGGPPWGQLEVRTCPMLTYPLFMVSYIGCRVTLINRNLSVHITMLSSLWFMIS